MTQAANSPTTPRAEPEVVAAQVRRLLGQIFRGGIGPAPVLADDDEPLPFAPAAALAEAV